jgi:hypothetical protein
MSATRKIIDASPEKYKGKLPGYAKELVARGLITEDEFLPHAATGTAVSLLGHLPAFDQSKSPAGIADVIAEMLRILPKWVWENRIDREVQVIHPAPDMIQ